MLLIIGALFVSRACWFKKSFTLQERQFNEKMNISLRGIAHNLLILNQDSTSKIPSISKPSSSEFYVETNCYYSLETFDSIITNEFSSRNIKVNYDYILVEPVSKKIALGNAVSPVTLRSVAESFEI